MSLKLELETDNAAFEDLEAECARILRRIADRISNGETGGKCMDANGNSVGTWDLEA